ncbi:hypothetical protein D3C86_1634310 [compost metagenome]
MVRSCHRTQYLLERTRERLEVIVDFRALEPGLELSSLLWVLDLGVPILRTEVLLGEFDASLDDHLGVEVAVGVVYQLAELRHAVAEATAELALLSCVPRQAAEHVDSSFLA